MSALLRLSNNITFAFQSQHPLPDHAAKTSRPDGLSALTEQMCVQCVLILCHIGYVISEGY